MILELRGKTLRAPKKTLAEKMRKRVVVRFEKVANDAKNAQDIRNKEIVRN